MQITRVGVTLDSLPADCLSVDIEFDEHRVWTIETRDIPHHRKSLIHWPDALTPHLVGTTEVTIIDSATGNVYGRTEIQFTSASARTNVTNDDGVPLAINKWGNLAPALEGMSASTLNRLLDRTEEVVACLKDLGFRPFIVGGTLLGAVRDGRLLPFDDDADVAYLSAHTHPADVAIEGFTLGHKLESLGYEFVRHSAAHIQLIFRNKRGAEDFHIDVFSSFFTEDGHINQPFHVRAPFKTDQMLPFRPVSIEGRSFPAPADVDSWLVANYDENWRTPIPGFRLVTPEATIRRFDNWFGNFNFQREFWDAWHEEKEGAPSPWSAGNEWLLEQTLKSPLTIELGSGNGALCREIARKYPSRLVVGTDFSEVAIEQASRNQSDVDRIEFIESNFNRFNSLQVIANAAAGRSFDVVANHLLEQVGHHARAYILRIIRMALHSGGRAYATSYALHAPDLSPSNPTTWHLAQRQLDVEARQLGMKVDFHVYAGQTDGRKRDLFGVEFSLGQQGLESDLPNSEGASMLERIKRLVRGRLKSSLVGDLEAKVEILQAEIDDCRRDSLRVAELTDVLETRLVSPGSTTPTE